MSETKYLPLKIFVGQEASSCKVMLGDVAIDKIFKLEIEPIIPCARVKVNLSAYVDELHVEIPETQVLRFWPKVGNHE